MLHRTVVIPDVHTPNHHEPSVKAVLSFIKYFKPHRVIQLGDFCDWDSVTHFAPRSERDIANITHEIQASNEILDRFEAVMPRGCHRVLLGGNHESRYEIFKTNHASKPEVRRLKEFSTWYEEYNLDKRGWDHREYGKWFTFWKVIYCHGFWTGASAAKRHLDYFKQNVIFGHLHEHQVSSSTDRDRNPVEAESIGTLSRFDLAYLKVPASNWVNGFSYLYTRGNGTFSKTFVYLLDGKFIVNGKDF